MLVRKLKNGYSDIEQHTLQQIMLIVIYISRKNSYNTVIQKIMLILRKILKA